MSRRTEIYREAQRNARATVASQTTAEARRILAQLRSTAEEIQQRIVALGPSITTDRLVIARRILNDAMNRYEKEIGAAVAGAREVVYTDVLGIWSEARTAIAKLDGGLLGGIPLPSVEMLGAYERMRGGRTWQNSLSTYTKASASDLEDILSKGMATGASPEALARRMRPYLSHAMPFQQAFGGPALKQLRDLRSAATGDPVLREAARKLLHQSQRIAFTESQNSRNEAEIANAAADPLIIGLRWVLSPYRGKLDGPDVCDALAQSDSFGLGPGVYPVYSVPVNPHPWCRCERFPVTRDPSQALHPKPSPQPKPHNRPIIGRNVSQSDRKRIAADFATVIDLGGGAEARAAVGRIWAVAQNSEAAKAFSKTFPVAAIPIVPPTPPAKRPKPTPTSDPSSPAVELQTYEEQARQELKGVQESIDKVIAKKHRATAEALNRRLTQNDKAIVGALKNRSLVTKEQADRVRREARDLKTELSAFSKLTTPRIHAIIEQAVERLGGGIDVRISQLLDRANESEVVRVKREGDKWLRSHIAAHVNPFAFEYGGVDSDEIGGFFRAIPGGGQIRMAIEDGKTSDYIHEFGHLLDENNRNGIQKRMRDFYWRRVGRDLPVPIGVEGRKLFHGRVDSFRTKYSGRIYGWAGGEGLEIPSTGLEQMYLDPVAFYLHDPEHFLLTLEMMLGL